MTRRLVLCLLGWHSWPRYVNAYTQAPAPVRCYRCGVRWSERGSNCFRYGYAAGRPAGPLRPPPSRITKRAEGDRSVTAEEAAEVLREHARDLLNGDCLCGPMDIGVTLAQHQADMLEAARLLATPPREAWRPKMGVRRHPGGGFAA